MTSYRHGSGGDGNANISQTERDEEFRFFVDALKEPVHELAITLRSLKQSSYPEERIIPYLKELLDNRAPCKTQIPYRYGEIRWLAAGALRRVYDALDIRETIVLRDVPVSQTGDQIGELVWELGVHDEWLHLTSEECFERLREMGRLTTHDEVFEWQSTKNHPTV